mgnify:CR=1 FL=1
MKTFAEMTKEEIAANFENRWDAEGYREAIEGLLKLEEAAADEERAHLDAYFAEIDRIAAEYGQGINTVANDTARL